MRPHRLRLTAFGPFGGEVEVDFDAMAATGLFLLEGDTGAGKTSILDGLAFALYGRVPGQRSGVGRLRSDHALASLRTVAELEVTIARRRLRIQRWPEQDRPKQRGSGTTRDPAKVILQEALDGGWVTLSTRVGEADDELSRLLGMSADQFHQVVLLPQGEFARFLRSDAVERGRLLQRLFATDRFRRVEDWLAERRRAVAAELEAGCAAVLRLAARVAQAAGVGEPAPGDDGVPAPGWATGLAEEADRAAREADAAAEAARVRQVDAESALVAARDLDRRRRRRIDLLGRQAELEAARPGLDDARRRLEAARRAAGLRSGLEQLSRRRSVAEHLAADVVTGRKALGEPSLEGASVEQLHTALEERRRSLGRLEDAQRVEDDLAGERSLQVEAARLAGAAAREAEVQHAELSTLPSRRQRVVAEVEAASGARIQVPVLAADAQRLDRGVRSLRALTDARAARRRLGSELLTAREAAVGLREDAARLRVERVDSMIAELSAALVEGDPCPVCGATEHPDPSEVRGSRVTREQEDDARAAADQAQQVVAESAAAIARSDAEIEALEDRLAEDGVSDLSPEALDRAAAAAGLALEAAQAAAARSDDLAADLRRLDELERTLTEAHQEAVQVSRVQAQRSEDTAERSGRLAEQLARLIGEAPDVASARLREQQAADRIDVLLEVIARSVVADEELAGAAASAADAVTDAGFSSVAEAEAALLPASEIEVLQTQVEHAHAAEVAVAAALADPDVAVDETMPAGVADAEQAFAYAAAEARAAITGAARCRTRAAEVAALAPRYVEQVGALAPVRRRAAEVKQLADLAAGQGSNRLRMTLSTYVLAARLEEVAAVASERLRHMTQGRYTLVHTDIGRGGGRSGLGLLARDTWTGQDRDTATLSGGETFLASLALALALGDVVAAEAGGTDIEALFIDEGFGSLDEETLEEVMDILDGLREGGRMVGVVSHVAELRSRIPAQIHVRKDRHGSSVAVQPG
jgi:exonuclease SbcC